MIKDDDIFLGHMLEYARLVTKTIKGHAEGDLNSDPDLLHLLVYRLSVIGEAARNVSDVTRKRHPELPWKEVIALRNRLAHGYFDINSAVVYRIVSDEIPQLIELLKTIVPSEYQTE